MSCDDGSLSRFNLGEFKYEEVECIGERFIKYYYAMKDGSFMADDDSIVEELFTETEADLAYLKSLDPREWKEQDHYAVLGLKDKRYQASFNEIKTAYRLKVLKHHPDKRKAKGEIIDRECDYFSCITKAWEILGDKLKRRSYDSVDPFFDDAIPSASGIKKANFFEVLEPIFEKNARWSERAPVPLLGKVDDPKETVEKFYSFWYNFDSWREYSYEDEESKERGQDRDERKWIEKQNKATRAKKKKEEMARIRSLVDLAYNADPRIARFKQEDKEKKELQKKARAEAARVRQEQLERAQLEEDEKLRKEKEEADASEKARQNALKAERELQKKLLKKERRHFREICKSNNYYVTSDADLIKNMEFVEKMCEVLEIKELSELNENLKEHGQEYFMKKVEEVESKLQQERLKLAGGNQKQDLMQVNGKDEAPWTQCEISLLIKGVNLFPAGTNQRWEVVANFINQHNKPGSVVRKAKDVLSKAKDLQTNDDINSLLKKAANQKAVLGVITKSNSTVTDAVETSQRFESVAEQQGISLPWTAEEQKLLEQALKTYPASTPDRWDQIATCIPSRSKKDCMKRYKELVEMVKAKKAAEKVLTKK